MRAGLRVLGLLGGAVAWAPFVGCDAFDPRRPPDGTGGLLGVGGVQATGGSGGSDGGGGRYSPCPPPQEDCCYEASASYYCSGDSACKDYHLALECGRPVQCDLCTFGCLDGNCLPDPNPPASGGGTGFGGNGGLGGVGGDGN